jgi:hypothetical protein
MMARKFIPAIVYRAPLAVAVLFFGLGLAAQNATEILIVAFWVCLVVAAILSLTVRTTEKVTFSATPEEAGSRVLVSGTAIPQLRKWVEASEKDGVPAGRA